MPDYTEIHDKLLKLKQQNKLEQLKLRGIDLAKLRTLEKQQSKEYQRLAKSLQVLYEKSGKEIADRHQRSQHRSLKKMARQMDHALRTTPHFPDMPFLYLCDCQFPYTADIKGTDQEIILLPQNGTLSSGSVNFDNSLNRATLFASANSTLEDDYASADVQARFKFAFTPESDGTYCINPVIHLNGYWLLWSGTACADFPSLPVAGIFVEINVRIEQLSDPVADFYFTVPSGSNSPSFSGAFDYDSALTDDFPVKADLTGGDQAVVSVSCKVQAYANNGIHATVDMQSSPYFYFEVPTIKWGFPCSLFTLPQRMTP